MFIDLEKAFDRVNWEILMDVLKQAGVEWKERRLIRNLYMNQRVRVRLGEEVTGKSELGKGVRQGCCLSPTLFNIYLEEIVKQGLLNEDGVFVGDRRVKCIRFADDMALLAESETKINEMLEKVRAMKYMG